MCAYKGVILCFSAEKVNFIEPKGSLFLSHLVITVDIQLKSLFFLFLSKTFFTRYSPLFSYCLSAFVPLENQPSTISPSWTTNTGTLKLGSDHYKSNIFHKVLGLLRQILDKSTSRKRSWILWPEFNVCWPVYRYGMASLLPKSIWFPPCIECN